MKEPKSKYLPILKKMLKKDIDRFFHASMSAVCHCYDRREGFYPENCNCETTEKVHEAMYLLSEEHRRFIKKYDL